MAGERATRVPGENFEGKKPVSSYGAGLNEEQVSKKSYFMRGDALDWGYHYECSGK